MLSLASFPMEKYNLFKTSFQTKNLNPRNIFVYIFYPPKQQAIIQSNPLPPTTRN